MSYADSDFWEKLQGIVTIVPLKYIKALSILHDKLEGTGIQWIVDGDLAERLRLVNVEPDCIEIVCSKQDAERLIQAVHDFKPEPIAFQAQQLSRNAVVEGREYPVYARSYSSNFVLEEVKVKVQGDLQFKVGNWEWGEVFNFAPEYVNIVGKKIAVTPLQVMSELYKCLGWVDRLEKLNASRRPLKYS
jgi:hypothetical protein